MLDRSTVQKITIGFGIVYLLVGIIGFIPGITSTQTNVSDLPGAGLIMGIFGTNLLHNLSHLLFAAILIFGGMSLNTVGATNRIMAVVFAVLVVGNFIGPVVNGLGLNLPDLFLHLGSALLTGYLGYVASRDVTTPTDRAY